MTFKVNDRVVIVESIYPGDELSKGQTGTVKLNINNTMFGIKMDNGYDYPGDNTGTWMFTENELQLIGEK